MYALQSRHLLSGWHGYAVALSCRLFLSGHHQCDKCTAPAMFCGVVLQFQRDGRRRALSSRLVMSHSRPVVGASSVPDRICMPHGGLGHRSAMSAGSLLPRGGSGDGCTVSVGPVQPCGGHEHLRGVCAVCAGLVGLTRPCRVHHGLPRWVVLGFPGRAVRHVSRRRFLPRRCPSGAALSRGYEACEFQKKLCGFPQRGFVIS
jgi:hypothetical protein